MSNYVCLLVTVYYESERTLLRCAIKVMRRDDDGIDWEYPMMSRDKLREILPFHVKSCGPIVGIDEIFEIAEVK